MKNASFILFTLAALLTGCQTQSISDSGYKRNGYGGGSYRGELSEFEVLGINAGADASEEAIREALETHREVRLKRGDTVVLVQSGAQFPDDAMMNAIKSVYVPIPLNGIPDSVDPWDRYTRDDDVEERLPLNKALRLAAARTGARTVIVYWGILEIGRENYATKMVSWVPIVGGAIPDEDQQMRIRLKAVVIDVETGQWEMLVPEAYSDERTSARLNRESAHGGQVAALKDKAYNRLVADLQTRYN